MKLKAYHLFALILCLSLYSLNTRFVSAYELFLPSSQIEGLTFNTPVDIFTLLNTNFTSSTPTTFINPADPLTTPTPSPTASPISTPKPQIISKPNIGGLNADKIFELTNNHRVRLNLPPFQKDERICKLAEERALEVGSEIAGGVMHQGLKNRNLPYWNNENIISIDSEEAAFNWWINDYIHKVAIEGNYTFSCVACSGQSCAQEFTNFQPK